MVFIAIIVVIACIKVLIRACVRRCASATEKATTTEMEMVVHEEMLSHSSMLDHLPGDWRSPGDRAEVPEKELIVTEPFVTFGRDTVRVKFCEKANIITSAQVINKKERLMEHFQPPKLTPDRINDKALQEIQQVIRENQKNVGRAC